MLDCTIIWAENNKISYYSLHIALYIDHTTKWANEKIPADTALKMSDIRRMGVPIKVDSRDLIQREVGRRN
jgi:hypothetical protein